MNHLKNNILKIMKKQNIKNQAELSKLTGISKSTLSNLLNEETKDPKLSLITKLKKGLNCTYDEILDEPKENN